MNPCRHELTNKGEVGLAPRANKLCVYTGDLLLVVTAGQLRRLKLAVATQVSFLQGPLNCVRGGLCRA